MDKVFEEMSFTSYIKANKKMKYRFKNHWFITVLNARFKEMDYMRLFRVIMPLKMLQLIKILSYRDKNISN